MATINSGTISPVEALWALYQAQSKANKKKFRSLLYAEDKAAKNEEKAVSLMTFTSKVRQEYKEGKGVTLQTSEDIDKWFESL